MNDEIKNKDEAVLETNDDISIDTDDIIIDEEEGNPLKIIKKLREKLKTCEGEKQNYLEGWQRSRADYVNAKKEEEKRFLELEPLIKQKILFEIIPIADNFDMAFSNKDAWEKVDKNWRIGIEGIYSNLLSIFSSLGMVQIGKEGDKFNPEEYQAVESLSVSDEEDDEKVLVVVQKGYKYKNKVIRPCKARVGIYKI